MTTTLEVFVKAIEGKTPEDAKKIVFENLQNLYSIRVLPNIYPAMIVEENRFCPCAAFNLEGDDAEQIQKIADQIYDLNIGPFKYLCLQNSKEKTDCFFAICKGDLLTVSENWQNAAGSIASANNPFVECTIMEAGHNLCYLSAIMPPEKQKGNDPQQNTIKWESNVRYTCSVLRCSSIEFFSTGYVKYPR